jgi:Asp-tRNA(Asn)/Glu-tRNA(Gln) amidotransferase A subunit family amidase
MRFSAPANLTGLPAISFPAGYTPAGYTPAGYTPAGYTPAGLPVGMQAIARPWDEVTLLRLALAAECMVERKAPQVHYRMI